MNTANGLTQYEDKLYGCRFCPMCKPAGEVANVTLLEGHTTRARAMMLWRVLHGMADWQPRGIEQLYQSTLDSISEAWCVSHYPVSSYVLAARRQVYEAGLAPEPVQKAVAFEVRYQALTECDVLLVASELAQLNGRGSALPAVAALERSGTAVEPVFLPAGAVAYALGDHDTAREQAQHLLDVIRACRARTLIADGPQTLWALKRILPRLGVELPPEVNVVSLAEHLSRNLPLVGPVLAGVRVLVHDSRAACMLADTMAEPVAIQPGYAGPEASLGTGDIYDAPRRIVDALGMEQVSTVWSRTLSRSDGSDDGLWQTYPELAERLARRRLAQAQAVGAAMIVADSPLSAAHLIRFADEYALTVRWLPELLAEVSQ